MFTRTLASLTTIVFILTSCGLGIAAPANLRQMAGEGAAASGQLTQEMRVAGAAGATIAELRKDLSRDLFSLEWYIGQVKNNPDLSLDTRRQWLREIQRLHNEIRKTKNALTAAIRLADEIAPTKKVVVIGASVRNFTVIIELLEEINFNRDNIELRKTIDDAELNRLLSDPDYLVIQWNAEQDEYIILTSAFMKAGVQVTVAGRKDAESEEAFNQRFQDTIRESL